MAEAPAASDASAPDVPRTYAVVMDIEGTDVTTFTLRIDEVGAPAASSEVPTPPPPAPTAEEAAAGPAAAPEVAAA